LSIRCSNCGKKIKKKSSFCIKCGAKVPPIPKKAKKQKKNKDKKKRAKSKIVIPFLLILVLAAMAFLIFGGDRVPEQIRNIKGYSYLTGMVKDKTDQVKDKLPDKVKLPFDLPDKFPFDFKFKLPFELPDPGSLLGDSKVPGKEKIMKDLAEHKGEDGQLKFDTLEIEKRTTVEAKKKDTIYVTTETEGEEGTTSNYYRLVYKRHLIGGWKLDEVEPYNVQGQKTSVAGVDNKTVLADPNIYNDISSEWEHSNVKVMEHYTDVKSGLDFVVVYMELKNDYVKMTGTKEVAYKYNDDTKKWEAVQISKLTALAIEPVKAAPTE
jgi:hypothetical protein